MDDSPEPVYRVIWPIVVQHEVAILVEQADRLGIKKECEDSLREAEHKMATAPLNWGDPEYQLKYLGLRKCHGILNPLIVYFAVDETRRLVYVQRVRLLPNLPLDVKFDD